MAEYTDPGSGRLRAGVLRPLVGRDLRWTTDDREGWIEEGYAWSERSALRALLHDNPLSPRSPQWTTAMDGSVQGKMDAADGRLGE